MFFEGGEAQDGDSGGGGGDTVGIVEGKTRGTGMGGDGGRHEIDGSGDNDVMREIEGDSENQIRGMISRGRGIARDRDREKRWRLDVEQR